MKNWSEMLLRQLFHNTSIHNKGNKNCPWYPLNKPNNVDFHNGISFAARTIDIQLCNRFIISIILQFELSVFPVNPPNRNIHSVAIPIYIIHYSGQFFRYGLDKLCMLSSVSAAFRTCSILIALTFPLV